MPQLARMLAAPMVIDVRRGALDGLGALLADRRIATDGRVAVAVGPGQGDAITERLRLAPAQLFRIADTSHDSAASLGVRLRAGSYEAVAGVGGGGTIDVTKFAAHMAGIPMVAVATSLAHDGIASPVASLDHESGKGRYGCAPPVAVVVDLDRVRAAPGKLACAGVGDLLANISAIADWELAAADTGERIDGLAVAMARTAAQAVLLRPGGDRSDEFLTVLAEALILSGMAMSVAGSSRPCSGGDHEIMHTINRLFPGTASHGELAGLGALFCAFLREDAGQFAVISSCLERHDLPRAPRDVGLSLAEFGQAVVKAPEASPGRYTILERLAMSEAEVAKRVEEYVRAIPG